MGQIGKTILKKDNGAVVPVIFDVPPEAGRIVIMIHGFESCKECDTGKLLCRRMIPAEIGGVAYDQPGHGSEEGREEWFTLKNCMDSLETVENFVAAKYPHAQIFYFASSFGAYMTSLYVSTRNHRGRKLFMRSAAVNMPEIFLGKPGTEPDPTAMQLLKTQGYVQVDMGIGQPVKVPLQMFEDMKENNLSEKFKPDKIKARMVHGEKDEVISPEAAVNFARRFGLPMTMMADEGHSLCNAQGTPDLVADMAIKFFTAE